MQWSSYLIYMPIKSLLPNRHLDRTVSYLRPFVQGVLMDQNIHTKFLDGLDLINPIETLSTFIKSHHVSFHFTICRCLLSPNHKKGNCSSLLTFTEEAHTQKNKLWIWVCFSNWFNVQTKYQFQPKYKTMLYQQ